jgi:protein involved in polysaccharide export with SLBB domain
VVDRDIVQVFRVGETRKNVVTIIGPAVMRPGTFQIRPGMKISDLIAEAGGLKPDAYLERGQLVRTSEDRTRSIQPFNVREAMAYDADDDLELRKLDEIMIRSIWEIQERHTVSIQGSVREPGSYEYLEGMSIMDLIFRAGGLRESAYKHEAEVARIDSSTIAAKSSADVYRVAISGDYSIHSPDTSFALQKMDQVFIREIPDWQMQRNVKVSGEVQYPGVYSLKAKDERLSSVLVRAGGLKPTSYPRAAVFVRRKGGAGRLAVDVESVARKNNKKYDLVLEDGDSLHIPREPKTVKVVGRGRVPRERAVREGEVPLALRRPGRRVHRRLGQEAGKGAPAERKGPAREEHVVGPGSGSGFLGDRAEKAAGTEEGNPEGHGDDHDDSHRCGDDDLRRE